MSATIQDNESGLAKTLRLSITAECNLDCFYCKPLGHKRELFTPKTLIQPSDVSKLVKIVGEFGVTKVILGGGEPLLRKDVANFVKASYAHKGIQEVRLVTNGTYLKAYGDALRKMGLRRVDINFDSLRYERYQAITRRDDLFRVLDGIEKVEKLNFVDIRLNILLLTGINEDELIEFSRLTKDRKLHVRLIEYHPTHTSPEDPFVNRPVYSVLAAKRRIDDYQKLVQIHDLGAEVPSPTFQFNEGEGKISFLSKMEIDAEARIPIVVFNADGNLYHEAAPNRIQPILADLRRDAKETKLHKTIERVLAYKPAEEKMKPAAKVIPVVRSSSRAKSGARTASARR
jgi:GTP 3',8-cyclase